MRNYWSNSKLADAIRGTKKPVALGWREWDLWNDQARSAHPVRYWIAEDLLDKFDDIVNFIPDKIHSIKYYLNNRFVSRSHALTAHKNHIKPGTWCDVSDRILYCLFDELVNFVEYEKAQMNSRRKYWIRGRDRKSGLECLSWEMTLKMDEGWGVEPSDPRYNTLTDQGQAAFTINKLYYWWTIERPLRSDPYEASGWTELCDNRRKTHGTLFPDQEEQADREETREVLGRLHDIEAEYDHEDHEMLNALMDIRKHLWT